ncbi:MAG TPA: PaaI family thioesterase [Syntrophorhabdaceae bacterium]|nr:PaaI family thioesterase [Syntrophorhabdaceae bacterium]HQM81698.1 PaaI family thioesterase [Syntrophorhabdaceae bacterium]
MEERSFQDYYPEELSHCYGCGRLNEVGLHIRSYWDGEESVARLTPQPCHIATPGFVYGGLIASLIDCHGVGTAAAATCQAEGREMDEEPRLRFVTASLKVDYLKPTPLGVQLEARGKVKEVGKRKVSVSVEVFAEGTVCARGEVIAVRMPETMKINYPSGGPQRIETA